MSAQHLFATRRALDRVVADPIGNEALARRLGLADAAWALRGWRQTLSTDSRLTLVLDPALLPAGRPQALVSAWDGREPIPIQCRESDGPAQAQSWATTSNTSRPAGP